MIQILPYLFSRFLLGTLKFTYCITLTCFVIRGNSYAQTSTENYDEITVALNVPRIGNWEMPAVINGQVLYIPVKDFFDILQIKNSASPTADSVSGFFINPGAYYLVDKMNNRIIYDNRTVNLNKGDLILSENNLYLKSDYFESVFGLACVFNFRSLSVTVNTKLELPLIRELQLQQMRKNITQLKGEKKADTTLKRKFSMLQLGMADWSIINYRQSGGQNYTRLSANLGAIIAGGEANVYINHNAGQPFNLGQQYYRWKYVNNDNKVLRQITAGNLFVQSTASVYGAITGIQVTNTPTTYRRSFGTYRLSNTTDPGWMVELYVNNILVNYTKADASGFYTFDVPLVYGSTIVKLKFYGPWGEERVREQNISIPFNFLPVKQFEYTLSAGVIDDVEKGKFSRLNLNYGLHSRITIGAGVEYLSTVELGKAMPFVNASVRMGTNLLISAEHTYGVRSKAIASYRLPSSLQLEVNYTKYAPGQKAIKSGQSSFNNYIDDKKATIYMPFRRKKFSGFSRLSISQLTVPKLKYTTAELLLSGMYKGINTNITTSAVYTDPKHSLVYSNIAVTFKVAKGMRVTPQAQYEYKMNKLSMIKCEVEKNLFNRGFMILSYENNMTYKLTSISLGVRYSFSFAQTSFAVSQHNKDYSSIQSARGSLLYNNKSHKLKFSEQSNVGRGGLIIRPFLDFNGNGKKDANEPKAQGLKVRINGGRIEHNKKDTTITISGLEAYSNYYLELDKNSFDNIGWQLQKASLNIVIEPNNFRLIEVPVSVMGEVAGSVYKKTSNGQKGISRIIINIYDKDSRLAGRTITESDGYFSFVGLKPGNYTAEIDSAQLNKINMSAYPRNIPVSIKLTRDGDLIEGLKFTLSEIMPVDK